MNEKLMLAAVLGVAGVAVYSLTRKSEPSVVAPPLPASRPVVTFVKPLPALDAGLTAPELKAIQNAVSGETLPANLLAFASTFEPMFPVAASLLRARAASLSPRTAGEPCCDDCAKGDKPPCTPKVTGSPIFRGLPTQFDIEV